MIAILTVYEKQNDNQPYSDRIYRRFGTVFYTYSHDDVACDV